MARAGKYEVIGGKELRRGLKDVEDGIQELKKIYSAAAAIVVDKARTVVPVRDGYLAQTIRGSGAAGAATVRAGNAKVPYAEVQEWGWPRRNIGAQPYLWPAAQMTEPEWVALYEKRIAELLAKVKGAPET